MNNQKTISSNLSDSLPNSIEDNNKLKNYNSTKLSKNINNNEKRQNTIIEISSSKKYNKSNGRNQILEEILNLNEKIKQNENELNDIKTNLINLKQEKKKKQEDIINLLSNKESIEEIYKNQIYFLINSNQNKKEDNITNDNKNEDKNNIFNVELNDIKESEQNQYVEQITNMINDIFQNNNLVNNKEIINIVNNSYNLLKINNSNNNDDIIIKDFFDKISAYISKESSGKFQDSDINLLLRYLLLINTINKKLEIYLKFVNKKYKEQKNELNNSYHELEKNIKNFKEKKTKLELQLKEYEEKDLNNMSSDIENKENNNKLNNDKVKENKIIYSKKNISKSNNYFIKSKRNKIKDIIDNQKENVNINKNLEKELSNDNKENKINNDLIIEYENINDLENKNVEEKRKIDRRAILKKINDYTFNINISNNKNIFTDNNSKTNINKSIKEKSILYNIGENEKNKSFNNRRKSDINFTKKINYNEKNQNQNQEIITYKISSINKNQLQEISNNIINRKDLQEENILSNYNSSNIIKRKADDNRIIYNNAIFDNENCLTNTDEKNHNYISIINITNNAPMQNKQLTIGEEEKIYNIDNYENENCDDLKINTMKIKNNILNEIDDNNNFDINNNNFFLTKESEENHDDIKKIKKINNNINKKSMNSKNIYNIDLTKYLNKNSEINDINENSLNNKNHTLNITSLNNKKSNHQFYNIYDSNLSLSNQVNSNSIINTLSPTKCNKYGFKNKINFFFNNVDNSTTLKVTKTKEVNLKEIKNHKLNDILNRRKLSKTLNIKNKSKIFSNSQDKAQNNKSQGTKDKLHINDKINNERNEKKILHGSSSLNKLKKNNLSLDKIEINKMKLKSKLSPNVIRKLKLINLPIPKNNKIKTEHNSNIIKKSLEKKPNNNYTFYQYINSINFDNKYISLTKQAFCYYRIYNINNTKINLEEHINSNIEKIGFYKGYISIILKSDLLQFIPKINNNNEINIKLKNIIGIQLEQSMMDIINQIELNEKEKEKNTNMKNKNNIFIFNLLLTDFAQGKIECLFDNFEIFMYWMKLLEKISEYYRNSDNINFNIDFNYN